MLLIGFVEHRLHDAFARGAEMEHWTLEYFSNGDVMVQTTQGQCCCHAPLALLIPPHIAYSERAIATGRWREHYAIFDPQPHWHHWLDWPQSQCELGILDLSYSPTANGVESALHEAWETQRSARANRHLLAYNAVERALLLLDEINPMRGHVQHDERIENVLRYIASHYHESLNLEGMARHACLSPSRFSHLFKQQTGQAPMQFLENCRLEHAAGKLLRSSDAIEQISAAVGFNNAFHFSTRFRRRFGQSPSRYRCNPSR